MRGINELVGMQFIRNPWNVASTAWPTGCSLGFVMESFRGQQGLRRALLVPAGCMYFGACASYDETCPASPSGADFRRGPLILEVSCIANLQPGTWIAPGSFAVGFGCASQRCAGGGPPSFTAPQRVSSAAVPGPCAPRMAAQRLFRPPEDRIVVWKLGFGS
ncbi:uncharacterized protein Triagg1_10104 [Trichoderma aggressivum f. europaeum]|uniref:Uncharacterized protein n=1 Tax=Trichoderma aggressivum f. europaeum TaxID=173218 RepID=A0AAE1I7H4_9HYPO|nr:hypothetical protein Triagg1_10104 [Trichoderma aggressivum f. europaeum]